MKRLKELATMLLAFVQIAAVVPIAACLVLRYDDPYAKALSLAASRPWWMSRRCIDDVLDILTPYPSQGP